LLWHVKNINKIFAEIPGIHAGECHGDLRSADWYKFEVKFYQTTRRNIPEDIQL
jgi:hypothetical protein